MWAQVFIWILRTTLNIVMGFKAKTTISIRRHLYQYSQWSYGKHVSISQWRVSWICLMIFQYLQTLFTGNFLFILIMTNVAVTFHISNAKSPATKRTDTKIWSKQHTCTITVLVYNHQSGPEWAICRSEYTIFHHDYILSTWSGIMHWNRTDTYLLVPSSLNILLPKVPCPV